MMEWLQTSGLIILACIVAYMTWMHVFTLRQLTAIWKEFGETNKRMGKILELMDR